MGRLISLESLPLIFQKCPAIHFIHNQIQKDDVRQTMFVFQKVGAKVQALFPACAGYDIKVFIELLDAVSRGELRYQIIINYADGH